MSIGPRIEVKKRCSGCDYKKSESYVVQGDSGRDVYCTHPSVGKKYVGDTNWTTPAWCPAHIVVQDPVLNETKGNK